MASSDVTAEGVERAIAEFDRLGREAFLSKYRFRQAREYVLIRGGRSYDSKAVVGAAHGYDRPDLGPLGPHDFSGGKAKVVPLLESLGFDIEGPSRNHDGAWDVFVRRARTYIDTGRLESEEIDYKVEIGRKLAEARDPVFAGADDWREAGKA